MEPITFDPLYMERVWGGRKLEKVYHRPLPTSQPYGESWELTDRPNEQSVVRSGVYQGMTLHQLWDQHREPVFGLQDNHSEAFPLLIKILDANSDLSIQVHPPEAIAHKFNGEPKSEVWYIAHAEPGAKLYVGLKKDVSKNDFQQAIQNGTVDQIVHVIEPKAGESIFIDSGRLHAIGAGIVIYEIQQNSDTTYRVFDWNRMGLDGKPRQLHIEESMACIDFSDFEPSMDNPTNGILADCQHFHLQERKFQSGSKVNKFHQDKFAIFTVVSGVLEDCSGHLHKQGSFLLQPVGGSDFVAHGKVTLLETTIPG